MQIYFVSEDLSIKPYSMYKINIAFNLILYTDIFQLFNKKIYKKSC